MEWIKDDYSITTDKEKIDVDYTHQFLTNSYWAEGISKPIIEKSIKGSLCFSVFHGEQQVGFARVISDEATFAYLADVFIDPNYRGKGLSRWLMEVIMNYPTLQGLRRFLLATRDAHGLYEKFGFEPISSITPWMQVHRPGIYKEKSCER
ncbi:GNAT family N-acetyltransferase [Flavisolibacter tropicus]|uniref:GNAT family acetyltransferase n=1 Tax=Flavisolibacter tropicus TaxID=1492898 RepID=A0A172TYQ2_9BACT|nr:GNAT family N-acetyltransferase [Flavisolibacter tropicus]ANE52219.1 GNAT family acetyltransferase [Flavisolibacter tropicus]